jgi:hypothetical protein
MNETTQFLGSQLLHNWSSYNWDNGVQLETLGDLTEIRVQTRNSVYEITVIDGASREILVRGGQFFPERTPARLAGSSMGGSFLKIGGIYVGFHMEIVDDSRTIITSSVQSVAVHSVRS